MLRVSSRSALLLVGLGALACVPTILGAWMGGLSYSPVTTVLFLAIGAGAVIQVVFASGRLLSHRVSPRGERGAWFARPLNAAGLIAGLTIMYVAGLWVAV